MGNYKTEVKYRITVIFEKEEQLIWEFDKIDEAKEQFKRVKKYNNIKEAHLKEIVIETREFGIDGYYSWEN